MGKGKLIVRPSGTESVIRITVEGNDINLLQNIVNEVSDVIVNCE